MSNFDILIIGAGISGAVLAERYAAAGKQVLVIEKRDYIGGNCYDYPVPNEKNQRIYAKYKNEADQLLDVHFVERLANYKYFNMDQAFRNALELFENLEINLPPEHHCAKFL